jgi:hypothetical protein
MRAFIDIASFFVIKVFVLGRGAVKFGDAAGLRRK